MAVNEENYKTIIAELGEAVKLVAVSKLKTIEEIEKLYALGQRDFGENYVQELLDKQDKLPQDIRWHFIGHLQSNKVKYIASFIHMVQGVDSVSLLAEINKQGRKAEKKIDILLQVHIAEEETKFGLNELELNQVMIRQEAFPNVSICGLMGMASFSDDTEKVRTEFSYLADLFEIYKSSDTHNKFTTLSMGMSGDYKLAIEEGSNMVRIGSLLFGPRIKQ
jgi:pyridoxal phosphate enzyme (YggS family)